jgi:hypothetical protein
MRARTIGQIATLMLNHLGGGAPTTPAPSTSATPTPAEASKAAGDIDFDALSSEEIDRLIGDGDDEDPLLEAAPHV